MDPITGIAALTGISLASLIGLRLKRGMQEGFAVLPGLEEDQYPASVGESQSRYNKLTSLLNPLINGLIPVDSSQKEVEEKRNEMKLTLGGVGSQNEISNSRTLNLNFKHKLIPRADGDKSIFGAMKFCRAAAQSEQPFSVLDAQGNVIPGKEGAVSADGMWKFDEICGVCLSGGVDEEGRSFEGRKGLIIDPDTREAAIADLTTKGYPYPRAQPSMAQCNGAPEKPVFAINQKDLVRYQKRLECMKRKEIDSEHQCGLCYESDEFYFVDKESETNEVSLVLQGIGVATVKLKGEEVAKVTLKNDDITTVDLIGAKENDPFSVSVAQSDEDAAAKRIPTVYGYFQGINPNGGSFTMPLNLLMTVDEETGASPNKSGGFYNFRSVNLEVAKMRPASGKVIMDLRGSIPFTFVSGSEFAAADCPSAPFQTNSQSLSAFATDQPCFVKGAKPGNYNDACLRSRILDAGCTNAGELFKTPGQLNKKDGNDQSLSEIYANLQEIKENDMIDPDKTKLCSGRTIATPCDPFIARPDLRFKNILESDENAALKAQAQQCLSYLYHNKGASQEGPNPTVGPTYSGLVTYKNNRKEVKNVYCVPLGALNPDQNPDAVTILANIADNGFFGKPGSTGIEAVRAFLNAQLELAVNMTRNANTDPDRRAAIRNCFGRDLSMLPIPGTADPTIIQDACGILARYVNVYGSTRISDGYIEISQLAVIDKNGVNVAKDKSTAGSTPSYPAIASLGNFSASYAVDGKIYPKQRDWYHSRDPGSRAVFKIDLGQEYDITRIIYITRGDNPGLAYRKNGIRIDLLNNNKEVVAQRTLDGSIRQDIVLLQTGASSECKSDIPGPTPVIIPSGFSTGLYVSFYGITTSSPNIDPLKGGWDFYNRVTAPRGYSRIHIGDQNNNTLDKLPKSDAVGMIAKGYYFTSGPGQLQLGTLSDDGIYVIFNGQVVINNWNLHGPTWNESRVIDLPAAGKYPIEVRYYEWYGGAVCNMYYKSESDKDWKSDLTGRFAYSVQEATQEETVYQQTITQQKAAVDAQIKLRVDTAKARLSKLRVRFIISSTYSSLVTPVASDVVYDTQQNRIIYLVNCNELPGQTIVLPENGGAFTYTGTINQFDITKLYNKTYTSTSSYTLVFV